MTDNNDDKTLNAPAKKTLTLKPGGMNQGTVRQDMGRGRTNAVVVETRKRRPMRSRRPSQQLPWPQPHRARRLPSHAFISHLVSSSVRVLPSRSSAPAPPLLSSVSLNGRAAMSCTTFPQARWKRVAAL